MPGIQLNNPGAATFSQIEQRFALDQGGKDHNIRFQGAQGLYTSDKASLASIKAFFGFPDQLQQRADKREAGVDQIKQAIDREYGPGMSDRVLQHISDEHGIDLSGGIKRSDLGTIREAIGELTLQDQRDAALQDNNTGLSVGGTNPGQLSAYFTRHFDVCSSPEFWSHQNARLNADNFGCTLALVVLDRIAQNGTATRKDLEDLHRVLGPFVGGNATPVPPLGDHLLGPVSDQNLKEFTQKVYDRYMKPDALWVLNFQGSQHQQNLYGSFPTGTGAERLTAMHTALSSTLHEQYMGSDNITGPLRGIV